MRKASHNLIPGSSSPRVDVKESARLNGAALASRVLLSAALLAASTAQSDRPACALVINQAVHVSSQFGALRGLLL